jgi:diguanylate cyclase (GGDEF)-like protein
MRFPIVKDIATKNVVTIDIKNSLSEAMSIMLIHEHRSVVVEDVDSYYILTVLDILNLNGNDLNINLKDMKLQQIPTVHKDKSVLDTLTYLNNDSEYICVVNDDTSLYGLITHTDITSNMDPDTLMDTYHLEDLLKIGKRMKWVDKDEITSKLIKDMVNTMFDNIIVVEDFKPLGILTTKDIMYLIKNKKNLDLPISTYMTSPVETINKKASIKEALEFITKKHYKRAIVVNDDGTMHGVIAQKDIISLTYSRWANMMKEYHDELSSINAILKDKNKEYEQKASTDSLTGLYNRYKFKELYEATIEDNKDVSLILIDIDFFKKVNDAFGHNIGDRVLVQVSHTLLRTLNAKDIICRWGGEEFVALLPNRSLSEAENVAQEIRKNISELDIEFVGNLTASFGVSYIKADESMEDAIDRADKALYLAKNSGRNCVKSELDL